MKRHLQPLDVFSRLLIHLKFVRSAITDDMAKSVASSIVCSRLDDANSLFFGTTQKNINRIQRVSLPLLKEPLSALGFWLRISVL